MLSSHIDSNPELIAEACQFDQLVYFKTLVHSMRCLQKKYDETWNTGVLIELVKVQKQVDAILEVL